MASAAPGWYPDPAGGAQARWWDGVAWTDALSPDRDAPPPVDARPVSTDRASGQAPGARGVVLARVSTVAIGLGLALVVVAVVSLAATHLARPDRADNAQPEAADPASSGPTPQPTTTTPSAWGNVDEDSRLATVSTATQTVTLALPGPPYALSGATEAADPTFDAVFQASATVHDATGSRPRWVSTVALAHLPADATMPGASAASATAMRSLLAQFFGATVTKVTDQSYVSSTVRGGQQGFRLTAAVHYAIDGLPSRYDQVTLIVVGLADGSWAMAVSTVPDDAPREQLDAAATALDSLTVS